MKSTFYGQEDHKHAFSIKLKHFPTFSTYFIFCTLHFVHGWHNLETAENSREKGSVDTTHISKALVKLKERLFIKGDYSIHQGRFYLLQETKSVLGCSFWDVIFHYVESFHNHGVSLWLAASCVLT